MSPQRKLRVSLNRQEQGRVKHSYFQTIEGLSDQESVSLSEVIDELMFNNQGLIPVIAQDVDTKEVLMMAWMNKTSLIKTLETGLVTYWSRSRNQCWVKGETSGHTQALVSMAFDCDGDTVLCQVKQTGPACHTGRPNCFYLKADPQHGRVCIVGSVT